MGKVISIFNVKGGVGKTASTVNLATLYALQGKKVLIVDVDKQSNATQYLGRYDQSLPSMYDVFLQKCSIENIIRDTDIEGLYIAPSTINLVKLEVVCDSTLYTNLKNLDYDYIFIDCPPDLNFVINNALIASSDVLVPVKLDNWALFGLDLVNEKINEIKQTDNATLRFMGAFITMDKRATFVSKEIKSWIKQALGDKLLKTSIRDNAVLVTSTFHELPVVVFNKNCNSSKDYQLLLQEISEKMEGDV